jgi:hypothetical protein
MRPGLLRAVLCGIIVLVNLSVSGIAPSPTVAATCQTFPETGKQVCDPFLTYWQQHGGLAQQGLPLTDAFNEMNAANGQSYLTQYFERARFEYHPEVADPQYQVLLGLLGSEQLAAKYLGGRPATASTGVNCFTQTNQCVDPTFFAYWQAHGGLAQQGLPLSEPFDETNPTDGKTYRTQYFERARFEYHPEVADPTYQVLLGLLGREQFAARYPGGTAPAPATPPAPAPSTGPAPVPSSSTSPTPAPTPTPSPAPAPAPVADNFQVAASVSNSSPTQNSRVTVTARLTNNGQGVAGATLATTWHYKSTTPGCTGGPSGADGTMSCTRDISTASKGYTVVIDVVVSAQGRTYTTSTSFTPR